MASIPLTQRPLNERRRVHAMANKSIIDIDEETEQRLRWILCFIIIAKLFYFATRVIKDPVSWLPDDAYYYLTLARNFHHLRRWTFDLVSATSGFHPLWAYMVVGESVTITILLGVFIAALTVVLLARMRCSLPVMILILGAQNFYANAGSAMEWSLVILLAVCYYDFVEKGKPNHAFVAACLGSLARTDFIVFPAVLFALSFFYGKGNKTVRIGFYGSLAGLAMAMLHNFAFTGSLLQTSVRMKLMSSNTAGGTAADFGLAGLGFGLGVSTFNILFVLLLADVAMWRRAPLYVLGAFVTVLVYAVIYSFVQPRMWYSALFFVPCIILAAAAFSNLPHWGRIIALAIIVATTGYSLWVPTEPTYPHQLALLKIQMPQGKVGAFNAGVLGYYHPGVVNLDGLMNDDVVPYIKSGRLPEYIDRIGINYIVDFENVFMEAWRRKMGGYDDPGFLKRLQRISVVETRDNYWRKMCVYKVNASPKVDVK
jgi:hypothetical protein